MSQIVERWLLEVLGTPVRTRTESFVRSVQNGQLTSRVLHAYGIITKEQLDSVTSLEDDHQKALELVEPWLLGMKIKLDHETLKGVGEGRLSAAVRLFYDLYLALKGRKFRYTSTLPVARIVEDLVDTALETTPCDFVSLDTIVLEERASGDHKYFLETPLKEQDHIIKWHRDRLESIVRRCREASSEYFRFIASEATRKQAGGGEARRCFVPALEEVADAETASLNLTYGELIDEETRAREMMTLRVPDLERGAATLKDMQKRRRTAEAEASRRAHEEATLMVELWNEIEDNDEMLRDEVAKKVRKKSKYEKGMHKKVLDVKVQKKMLKERRGAKPTKVDEEAAKRVLQKAQEAEDDGYRYYFERDRTFALHRQLYAEKLRLRSEMVERCCRKAVDDLIDVVFAEVEHKLDYGEELSRRARNDLVSLFVSCQPIFDLATDPSVVIEYRCEGDDDVDDAIILGEIERQGSMDARDFERYCEFAWPYSLERGSDLRLELCDDVRAAMNVLGHVVFRLLLGKYPKPVPPPPPDLPKFDVRVCVNGIEDLTILTILSPLLAHRKIKVVQMEDVVTFCVGKYKKEVMVEYPEEVALVPEVKKEKKRKGKHADKNKKSKGKERRKRERTTTTDSAISGPIIQNKQNQTPLLFPDEKPSFSRAGELGRSAFQTLNVGGDLDDKLLMEMLVEHLKTLGDFNGWVLINFPDTFQQVVLLEQALTSKRVSMDDASEDETKPEEKPGETGENVTTSQPAQCLCLQALPSPAPVTPHPLSCSKPTCLNAEASSHDVVPPSESFEQQRAVTNASTQLSHADADDTHRVTIGKLVTVGEDELDPDDYLESDEDPNEQFRTSAILTNPDPPPRDFAHETHLTAYVDVRCSPPDAPKPYHVIEEQKADELEEFYTERGCFYILQCNAFDLDAAKLLARLVIGDYSIPVKTELELFGNVVEFLEKEWEGRAKHGEATSRKPAAKNKKKGKAKGKDAEPKRDKSKSSERKKDADSKKSKRDKSKSNERKKDADSKKSKRDKSKSGGKKEKRGKMRDDVECVEHDDKETQAPEVISRDELLEDTTPPPRPGEDRWTYRDFPIADLLQVALATLWENVEAIYVEDFKDLFFRRRLVWRTIVPYMDFVKRYLGDFIVRPDDRQIHLHDFQTAYNEFDADMRRDLEVKAELHMRTHEFKEKMLGLCDGRMREAQKLREELIATNWTCTQLCELGNVFVGEMQLELERCVQTLQLVNDYYSCVFTGLPSQGDVLTTPTLDIIVFGDDLQYVGFEKYSKHVQDVLLDAHAAATCGPFEKFIEGNATKSGEAALNNKLVSISRLSSIESYFFPGGKGAVKKRPKTKTLPKFEPLDAELFEHGPKLIDEWRCVIEGEVSRALLRFELIKLVALDEILDVLTCASKTFHGIYSAIEERYKREIAGVETVCDVILRAIEEEEPIAPMLVLDGDRFYVDLSVKFFDEPLVKEVVKETRDDAKFTLEQLDDMVSIFMELSPSGLLPERTFTYLLQDMIVHDAEDGRPWMVPDLWRNLKPNHVDRLCSEIFGDVEMVDWKDFVVWNLNVAFPNENQMMNVRTQFRKRDVDRNEFVSQHEYDDVIFWFENDNDSQTTKVKQLLFKMYKIHDDCVNYTALLLTFCKDVRFALAVAKALELVLGKLICWNVKAGAAFLENTWRKQREEEEHMRLIQQLHDETLQTVTDVIDSLVDTTVHTCDSCYLEDYMSVNEQVTNQELEYLQQLAEESEQLPEEFLFSNSEDFGQYNGVLLEDFENVEIGFEADEYPYRAYFLPFDAILKVMTVTMPWVSVTKNFGEVGFLQILEEVYEESKRPEFDDKVLMFDFLNSPRFHNLFERNFKFCVKNHADIVRKMLLEE